MPTFMSIPILFLLFSEITVMKHYLSISAVSNEAVELHQFRDESFFPFTAETLTHTGKVKGVKKMRDHQLYHWF